MSISCGSLSSISLWGLTIEKYSKFLYFYSCVPRFVKDSPNFSHQSESTLYVVCWKVTNKSNDRRAGQTAEQQELTPSNCATNSTVQRVLIIFRSFNQAYLDRNFEPPWVVSEIERLTFWSSHSPPFILLPLTSFSIRSISVLSDPRAATTREKYSRAHNPFARSLNLRS